MPINVELLQRVKAHILEEPRRIGMGHWLQRAGYGVVLKDDYESPLPSALHPPCGTVACIGGWAHCFQRISEMERRQSGGCSNPAALQCILAFGQPSIRGERLPYSNLLGLDEDQALRLFHVCHWPDEFRKRMEMLTSGTPEYAQVVADRIDAFIKANGEEEWNSDDQIYNWKK